MKFIDYMNLVIVSTLVLIWFSFCLDPNGSLEVMVNTPKAIWAIIGYLINV